jgi:hypothetical protein
MNCLALVPVLWSSAVGGGPVDLSLTPAVQCVAAGDVVDVHLLLSSDSAVGIAAVDALLGWDPLQLELLGATPGAGPWFLAGFLPDPDGLNGDLADGDALYTLLANPATPPTLPPDLLAATFQFRAHASGQVALVPSLGTFGATEVIGVIPGQNLTGSLSAPAEVGTASALALAVTRLGSPPNPDVFETGLNGPPVLGETWQPFVDHTTFLPAALFDGLAIGLAPLNVPLPGYGTLLLPLPPLVGPIYTVAGVPFAIPVPDDCVLAGVALVTQAFSFDGGGNLALTNALDLVLGTF